MSNKIKPEDLEKELKNYLLDYVEDIEQDVKIVVDDVTNQAKEELKTTSPRGKGTRKNPYYKGWSVKNGTKQKTKYTRVIWNRTNYQLTHLLEFGHATRNGRQDKSYTTYKTY